MSTKKLTYIYMSPSLRKGIGLLTIVLGMFLVAGSTAQAALSISGTLYENNGTTPITAGKTITAAIGTSTPSLHSATSDGSGNYTISGIATSTGGTSWTGYTPVTSAWLSVTYGNGLFVAVACGSASVVCNTTVDDRVMTSPDGVTWTARAAAGNNDSWLSVTYGNGLFVAVGFAGDRVMTSPDGINWSARKALNNDDSWRAVTYGNGLFVALSYSGDRVMTSPDGITWTARSAAGDNDSWYNITYAGGQFVAVACGSTGNCDSVVGDRVMTSPDGITWTARSAAGDNDQWGGITYGNGVYVAVGFNGDRVMTSPDGITWTVRTGSATRGWRSVVYANDLFVAVACGSATSCNTTAGSRVMTSSDGITWSDGTAASDDDNWYGSAYGNGKFVAVGAGTDRVITAAAGFGDSTSITVYVNGDTNKAATLTHIGTTTTSITDLDLYAGTVRAQHSVTDGTINFSDVDFYDYDQDRDIIFDSDAATTSIGGTATTTDFLIATGTKVLAPQNFVLYGDVVRDGLFRAEGGTTYLSGASQQTVTSSFVTTEEFYNLTINNISGTGSSTQSIIFGDSIGVSETFTMAASTSARFTAGETLTTQDIVLMGTASSSVWLRSSSNNSTWSLDVTGEQVTMEYIDVKDSTASSAISVINGTDSGNNTNWTFLPIATAAVWNSTNWTQYATIVIDQTAVDADLTDYPVYVDLTDLPTEFWNTTIPDCGDIRVMNESLTTEFAREVVECDLSTQTGELYVQLPSISSTTDTTFRIYWNGTHADYADAATYGQHNVWDASIFERVFHLAEGRGVTTVDSTADALVATFYGGPAWEVDARYETGVRFDGKDDYLSANIPESSYFSGWFKTSKITGTQSIIGNFNSGNALNRRGITVFGGNAAVQNRGVSAATVDVDSGYAVANNQWHSTYGRTSAGNYAVFGDGVLRATSSDASSGTYNANEGTIGRSSLLIATAYFDGVIDEARVYASSRSDAWIKAEYLNRATTTDFYTLSFTPPETGSSTVANHDATQVSNAFSYQNKTNEELFAFKLTPNTGTATVTALTLTLNGIQNVTDSDFTNVRLIVDADDNGIYDSGSEPQIGGIGAMSIVGQTGTIIFTEDFSLTTATNYLVVANFTAPVNGSFMRVTLEPGSVTIIDTTGQQDIFGSVSLVQHNRNNKTGGGVTAASDVGGAAPAGNSPQTGGGTGGGEQIGSDLNYRQPTIYSGVFWSLAPNSFDQIDGTYANYSIDSPGPNLFSSFSHVIGIQNTIIGIEVKLEAKGNGGAINASLSWNNGGSISSTKSTGILTASDAVYTLGGPTDLWGRSWSVSEFSNGNFGLQLYGADEVEQVDEIQVRVYYQVGGGGGGGGADI